MFTIENAASFFVCCVGLGILIVLLSKAYGIVKQTKERNKAMTNAFNAMQEEKQEGAFVKRAYELRKMKFGVPMAPLSPRSNIIPFTSKKK